MGFFDNNYDRYGNDSYSSVSESSYIPSYNNRYSNISDMYEVACQLEIDGNDLIHEMEMNILMNEHNYFVEHGRAVQYSDGYGYLTEEGNSVWRFIQKAWETLMKYLDQCVSWVIDKCKEYMIYFKQLWAQKISLKDGINGFKKSIPEACGKLKATGSGSSKIIEKAAEIKSSIKSAIDNCYISTRQAHIWGAYPTIDNNKIISKSNITDAIDTAIKNVSADDSKTDMKDAIRKALKLDHILGDDKADSTDQLYLYAGAISVNPQNGNITGISSTAIDDSTIDVKADASLGDLQLEQIQTTGADAYKLLQKEFSDSIKDIFEHIRDKKKDLRSDRIDNRADDGENEAFKQLKKKIKAYNIAASLIMKSYSMKINVCVTIVNKCVTCLNKVKNTLKDHSESKTASFKYVSDRDGYNGGYQALF